MDIAIREAIIPDEVPSIRLLFQEYAAVIGIDLCFQDFETELAQLPGRYAQPEGGIWLATHDAEIVGCVALRPLDSTTAEMKRLFVRSTARGQRLGRRLAEQIIIAATAKGYGRLRLDTLPSMTEAIRLYRSLGFMPIEPYCRNPTPGALFFELDLTNRSARSG